MATKPALEQNWRSRFAEAMGANPPLVSGDHHIQQSDDGVATMRVLKVTWAPVVLSDEGLTSHVLTRRRGQRR
jgi:hypothetical protein